MINTSKNFNANGYENIVKNSFGIFRLASSNNSFKGWIIFELVSNIKVSKFTTIADIDISISYANGSELDNESSTFTFQGSFLKDSDGNLRASISRKSTTDGHGGIYVDPPKIRGHRVASLAMDHIVQFLKKFPEQTVVNPIKFEPEKNSRAIAKNFYSKFGIPLDGSFLIRDLKTNNNWKERLIEYSIQDLTQLNEFYMQKLQFLKMLNKELLNITHRQKNEKYKIYNIMFGANRIDIPDLTFNFNVEHIEINTNSFLINRDFVTSLLYKINSFEFDIEGEKNAKKNLLESIETANTILVRRFDIPRLFEKLKLNNYVIIFLFIIIIAIYLKLKTIIG